MYSLTSGYISFILSNFISLFKKSLPKTPQKNSHDIINQELINNGYCVLQQEIKNDEVEQLYNLTKIIKCSYMQGKNEKKDSDIFDINNFIYPTYSYKEEELILSKNILSICTNDKYLNIARDYLKAEPILKDVNMWWSTPIEKEANAQAAQLYHYDLDGIKWLKFFIYLTDVDIKNGPHVYVPGTHKPFSKPYNIMLRGYKRVGDKEIIEEYGNSIISIEGKSGTMIIGDTSCFHKGEKPISRCRLIFEFQYANSLFGPPFKDSYKIARSNRLFQDYSSKNMFLFQKYYNA
jgi:hypothetical protein